MPPHSRDGSRSTRPADAETKTKREVEVKSHRQPARTARRVDPKRIAREQRLARQRRIALLRLAGVAILFVAIVVGAVGTYRSDFLSLERVVVEGVSELSAEEVRELAAVPEDATLLRFPAADVEGRLRSHPWIAAVSVGRDFPDGMRILIEERRPVAFVDVGGPTLWLVGSDGFVIDSRMPTAGDTLVVIRDMEEFEPVVGEALTDPAVHNALTVLTGISDELRSIVRAVSAPSVDRTALITTDDVEVLVGSADELELKDAVARQILTEQAGRAVYVNVRTPERPTWRGLDTSQ